MERTPRRRALFWLAYLLSVGAAAFLVLEAAVRLLDLVPPLPGYWSVSDPHLPYRPRPSSVAHHRTPEIEQDYHHNSVGFRDVEHSLDKPAGVFRILGLGDSFTYGVGAAFEETFLHRLEGMLKNRPGSHPRVEIIKAGIYRYFPEPQRLLLQHYGLAYSPDLVTVGFLPNDLEDTHYGVDAIKLDESGNLVSREAAATGRLTKALFIQSAFCRLLLGRYRAFKARGQPSVDWTGGFREGGPLEQEWRMVESEYQKMAEMAHSAGAQLVIVYIPQRGPWEARHSYPAERLSRWAARHGVEFVDVLPAMKEAAAKGENLYYERDGHCRPAGYAIVARVLFEELTRRGLVP